MNFINGERATGKTTKLIYASYVTGYPIITEKQIEDNSNADK